MAQLASDDLRLVKYRVPEEGRYPENVEDLEDAQQAMRLTRAHAAEWHIDSKRIGVIGFSAGAHLAAVLSTHSDFQGKNVPASTIDARPDFQMIIYPGWTSGPDGKVNPAVAPTPEIPPTFLLQAENDYAAHVESSLVYFQALKDAKIPAELHVFTPGRPWVWDASDGVACLSLACAGGDVAAYASIFLGRRGRWAVPETGQVAVVRLCQMSRRVSARVKRTGPRTMPRGPKRAMPPRMESRMVAVWARRCEPTRMG